LCPLCPLWFFLFLCDLCVLCGFPLLFLFLRLCGPSVRFYLEVLWEKRGKLLGGRRLCENSPFFLRKLRRRGKPEHQNLPPVRPFFRFSPLPGLRIHRGGGTFFRRLPGLRLFFPPFGESGTVRGGKFLFPPGKKAPLSGGGPSGLGLYPYDFFPDLRFRPSFFDATIKTGAFRPRQNISTRLFSNGPDFDSSGHNKRPPG
jgi:hypothetical protein